MPAHSNIDQLLKKLARPAKKIGPKRVKEPWRHRKSNRAGIKLTDAERQERKERREKKRDALEDALTTARETMYKYAEAMSEQFGGEHGPDYYYQRIMQRSTLKIKPKKISRWNVFVHKGMKELNQGQSHGNREQLHKGGHMKELSERWKNMSEEERTAAIGDGVEELVERRENRKEGVHNVLINSFHDTRATLAKIQQELEFLAGRTGMCVLTIAVRPNLESYNAPFVFVSEPRVSQYFETLTKKTLQDLVMGLEGFIISGITSLTQSHRDQLGDWKQKTANLILEKLRAAVSSRGDVSKMYYINFGHHITFKFGVILESWPLEKFAPPSTFSSVPILSILYSAFESGATRFRMLTDEEWQEWRQDFQADRNAPAVTAAESLTAVKEADAAAGAAGENPEDTPVADPSTAPEDATPSATSDATPHTNSDATRPANSASASAASLTPDGATATQLTPVVFTAASLTGALPPMPTVVPAVNPPLAPDAVNTRGQKHAIDQVDNTNTADVFVNNFGGADGLVQVTKRSRKKRSDAGVKRGPRKNSATGNATPTTA